MAINQKHLRRVFILFGFSAPFGLTGHFVSPSSTSNLSTGSTTGSFSLFSSLGERKPNLHFPKRHLFHVSPALPFLDFL